MDRREYLISLSILLISTSAAFGVGSLFFNDQPQRYSELFNTTVGSDQPVKTVDFDNQSLQLMFESGQKARMYIDTDKDGSFDIELRDLVRDGEKHTLTQLVTYSSTSYRLYFRYSDDKNLSGDGFLTLYRIQEL
jgi:hypothetical protein